MPAIACLVLAAVLLTVGAALIFVPAGFIVAGCCAGFAGWDLLPSPPKAPEQPVGDGR